MGMLFLGLGIQEFFILFFFIIAPIAAKVVYIIGLSKFKSSCIQNNIDIHPDFYPLILLIPLYSFFYEFTLLDNANKISRGSNDTTLIIKTVKIIEAICGLALVFLNSLEQKFLASIFVILLLALIIKYIFRLILISSIKVELD